MNRGRNLSSSQVSDWLAGTIRVPSRVPSNLADLPLDTTDNKGLIWYLGTRGYLTSWANPNGTFTSAVLSTTSGGSAAATTDRAASDNFTINASNSWWRIDVDYDTVGRRLYPTYMRFRQRSSAGALTQGMFIEGSNDLSSWSALATVSDGSMDENINAWTTITLSPAVGPYRYVRATQNITNTSGTNYFCIGEIELFGSLVF